MSVDLPRMDASALADEGEHGLGLALAGRRPAPEPGTRMHQVIDVARQEPVIDEEVFLDGQPGVGALQIARAIPRDAMAQRQILRPRRRPDRVGLNESEPPDGRLERGRCAQAAGDGQTPQDYRA